MPNADDRPIAVTLLSGGLDSAVTLAVARREGFRCAALSVDYGQRHRHELDAAGAIARSLGATPHVTVPLDLRALGGSALTDDIDVPKDRTDEQIGEGVPVTYVPARNTLFLALAAGWAESLAPERPIHLFIGVNALDCSGYPDCRPAFIGSMERALRAGTRAGAEGREVRIHAPLVSMTKADIVRLGATLGVDLSLTTSCYDPDGRGLACGRCDACALRRRGFEQAGVADPTRYARRVPERAPERAGR